MLCRKSFLSTLGLITVLALTSCAPAPRGAFSASGYQSRAYGYSVVALPDGQVLPSSWQLDNYYFHPNGRLLPKTADGYLVKLHLDIDGDGNYETSRKEHTYDLRYKNLVDEGVIFLRTIPISTHLRHKKLESLMDGYIEYITGAGYEIVTFGKSPVIIEKRYAAMAVERSDVTLAGLPAHQVTLEVANLDQLELDPSARKTRVRLLLLHTNFGYRVLTGRGPVDVPVVMFAGYANQPQDFETGLKDFDDLLSRVVIDGQRGYDGPPRISSPPAAPVTAHPLRSPGSASRAPGEETTAQPEATAAPENAPEAIVPSN